MAKRYITQGTLKKTTLADIFIIILERRQTTRREIEYETGFSWGTVSSHVAFLIEKGYVTEERSGQGSVGRTTYLLKPNAEGVVSIGLDINLSGLSCEIVGLDSTVRQTFSAPLRVGTQAEVIGQAETLCQAAMDRCAAEGKRVFSLGIAIQGTVNGREGISLRFPGIPDWQVCNIKEHFARRFGLPVYLGHDPKCMLLGEMHRQKEDNCLLLRVDDGIGMAVCLDGKILDDTQRLELGHTLAVPGGRLCHCGRRGCLEAYASVPAMAQEAGVDGAALLRAPARYGASILSAGERMSVALYNMYMLFRPQTLILTGSAAGLEDYVACAVSRLREETVEIRVNPHVSAAYGAAVESMKSAVRAFVI